MQHYETISLEEISTRGQYEVDGEGAGNCLSGLSHINFFIGPNNCGKSRFLRSLANKKHYRSIPSGLSAKDVATSAEAMRSHIESELPKNVDVLGPVSRSIFSDFVAYRYFDKGDNLDTFKNFKDLLQRIVSNTSLNASFLGGLTQQSEHELRPLMESIKRKAADELAKFASWNVEVGNENRVYVPVLRGLRPVSGTIDSYADRTKLDYFNDAKPEIFTGLSYFTETHERKNGSRQDRLLMVAYEAFLSKEIFDGEDVELIARAKSDTVYVRIGNNDDRPIYDLGDGIQTLLILTFLPFITDVRTLYFIEEPDMALHPGMQRKFIDLLCRHERFQKHQFFLTTHSNHLLDMTIDYGSISVFLFKKTAAGSKPKIKSLTWADRELLHEIGAKSSSLFLTNASIWVEGITDRLYLREFLTKFAENSEPQYKEDTHFSLLEFAGSNVVHWSFDEDNDNRCERINTVTVCSSSLVILDGDNAPKGDRVRTLQEELGERLILLKGKEIENLLPAGLVVAAAKKLLNASRQKKIDDKLFATIKPTDFQSLPIGIGAYLDTKLGIEYFASPSGSLKSDLKLKFCRAVVDAMQDPSTPWDLPEEAKELCVQLYEFIRVANS